MPSVRSLLASRYILVDGEGTSTPSIGLIVGLLVLSICLCLSAWYFHVWVKRRRVQRLSQANSSSRDGRVGQYHQLSQQRQQANWGWWGADTAGGLGHDAEWHSGSRRDGFERVAPPAYVA